MSQEDNLQKRQMTFGEKLVSISLNPSNDPKIDYVKRLCAELADMVCPDGEEVTPMQNTLRGHVIGEILNCQMNVVKYLTLKY
jgi:hypothetical protein